MKYAVDTPGAEACSIIRGIELGVELVLDSMSALCDICFHFDARQNF